MPDYTAQLNQERARQKVRKTVKKIKKKIPGLESSRISGVEFVIIGSICLITDIIGWLGLGLLSLRITHFVTTGILGIWCIIRLKKFPSARFGITFIIELIPILGDISPTWTIFIITIYLEQRGYIPKIEFLKKLIE